MAGKKKKNAPDKPQPAWLFPPEEKNPVLNPPKIDAKEEEKEKQAREKALDFLNRRAVSAPDKPAPPPLLLNMIAVFLAEYGFSGTCRLFTVERQGRSALDGWKDQLGTHLPKDLPSLARIFKDWHQQWEDDHSSSSEDDVESPSSASESSSESESESSSSASDSSSESEKSPPLPVKKTTDLKTSKRKRSASPKTTPQVDTNSKKPKSAKTKANGDVPVNGTSASTVPSSKAKVPNKPFSRIGSDVQVDEKLASNAYVPYDYAERAHRDLIVTKGKGFTKEKNKKKRGSYRGGAIDVDGRKGIKFED